MKTPHPQPHDVLDQSSTPLADAIEEYRKRGMAAYHTPGIPLLGPGEEVSEVIVEYLTKAAAGGLSVHGPQDRSLATLRIFEGGSA